MAKLVNNLFEHCKILETDYIDYGGKISRFADPDYDYRDCSCGCRYFIPLHDAANKGPNIDFGVCTNPKSRRNGLLTFERQAGYGCFQSEDYTW